MKWMTTVRGVTLVFALVMMTLSAVAQPFPCTNCPPPCTNCPAPPTSPPPYSVAGLKLTIPVLTNSFFLTTVFEHDASRGYELYYVTNLNQTNWTAVLGNLAGQTNYWLSNSFPAGIHLKLASGLDSDGDGMLDGWELLHGFNPHNASDASQDYDGDGLTNLQEFLQGSDPKSAASWTLFIGTPRGLTALP